MVFNGSEHFIANGEEISVTMSDFWKWSYPDFLDNSRRNTLSKFIVASSIGQSGHFLPDGSAQWTPYDMLTGDGYRLQIEAASYLQSQDEEHPDILSDKWDAGRLCVQPLQSYFPIPKSSKS